jgi:hypothetical protein
MNTVTDEKTIHDILDAVQRGVPRAIAISYHTVGNAKPATDVKVVQQTIKPAQEPPKSVQATPKPAPSTQRASGTEAKLEEMSTPQLLRNLRAMTEKHTYPSITRYILDSRKVPFTASAVRLWAYGAATPFDEGVEGIRRMLIQHRDHPSTMKLEPAGHRDRHPS